MEEGFIDRFRRLCGGSKVLALLIGVNIAIGMTLWVVSAVMEMSHADASALPLWFSLPSGLATFLHRPWTLLTYMVTQFSLLHLLFNMLWLYWFGRMMLFAADERSLSACYLGGGIAGGMAYLLSATSGVPAGDYLCGASASVLAVMCAVAFIMPGYELNLFIFGRVRLKWFAAICVLLTLLGAGGSTAATIAHIGGIFYGMTYGCIVSGCQSVIKMNGLFNRLKSGWGEGVMKRRRRENKADMIKAVKGRLNDNDRLDELLDKIRLSGYPSLTESERKELDALSSRIGDRRR